MSVNRDPIRIGIARPARPLWLVSLAARSGHSQGAAGSSPRRSAMRHTTHAALTLPLHSSKDGVRKHEANSAATASRLHFQANCIDS